MSIELSAIVCPTAGHDKGVLMCVIDTEGEYLTLADGKLRKIEHPKLKKAKHVILVGMPSGETASRIQNREKVTNNEIKKLIAEYSAIREIIRR